MLTTTNIRMKMKKDNHQRCTILVQYLMFNGLCYVDLMPTTSPSPVTEMVLLCLVTKLRVN